MYMPVHLSVCASACGVRGERQEGDQGGLTLPFDIQSFKIGGWLAQDQICMHFTVIPEVPK